MINVHSCSTGDPNDHGAMRHMFGPQAVDQAVRGAISTCWMILPKEKKNPDVVAAEVRRIVERALKDLQEDAKAFGIEQREE